MRILVTGGTGYVGSHTLVSLLKAGHETLVIDNLSNSSPVAVERVRVLANNGEVRLQEGDLRDNPSLVAAMEAFKPDVVIHFAGLKAVGESVDKPLTYYDNNVTGTMNLLRAMDATGCKKIVFSSSATVYGEPQYLPIDEAHPRLPTHPYGWSKMMAEQIIEDWCSCDPTRAAVLLRYFNPVGAHESGQIGEDPTDIPNNLLPFITQVAVGRRPQLSVFGNDYDTVDGTGMRDYIHVTDLAEAHLAAMSYVQAETGCEAINVGSGEAYSVLQFISAFEAASGKEVPYQIIGRRPGDIACSVADVARAKTHLGWQTKLGLAEICRSSWRWQSQNPTGYNV